MKNYVELNAFERIVLTNVLKSRIRQSDEYIKANPNDLNAFFVQDELPVLKALLEKVKH